jgi:hypothetical protein
VGDFDFGDFEGLGGIDDGEIDGLTMMVNGVHFFWKKRRLIPNRFH